MEKKIYAQKYILKNTYIKSQISKQKKITLTKIHIIEGIYPKETKTQIYIHLHKTNTYRHTQIHM